MNACKAIADDLVRHAIQESARTRLERSFATYVKMVGLPEPEREYKAIPGRDFRFDFAWPEHKLLVEIQGGVHSRGKMGHNSGSGIERDALKSILAQLLGYRVFPITEKFLRSGEAIQWVTKAIMNYEGHENV